AHIPCIPEGTNQGKRQMRSKNTSARNVHSSLFTKK
ncbi:hypothetical protein G0U57_008083, partial [Chelydra serpentina]